MQHGRLAVLRGPVAPVIVVLATALAMGTTPVPGATGYSWLFTYRDGTVESFTTTDPRLDFVARAGHCFTLTTCAEPGHLCSEPSYEVCTDPIAGDTAPFDGTVGFPDYLDVGRHFGETAP